MTPDEFITLPDGGVYHCAPEVQQYYKSIEKALLIERQLSTYLVGRNAHLVEDYRAAYARGFEDALDKVAASCIDGELITEKIRAEPTRRAEGTSG